MRRPPTRRKSFPCPRASARPGRGTRRAARRWPRTLAATSRARPCISRLCRARDGQHGTQGDGEGRRESHALEDRDAPAVVLGACVEVRVLDVLRAVEVVPFDRGMFASPSRPTDPLTPHLLSCLSLSSPRGHSVRPLPSGRARRRATAAAHRPAGARRSNTRVRHRARAASPLRGVRVFIGRGIPSGSLSVNGVRRVGRAPRAVRRAQYQRGARPRVEDAVVPGPRGGGTCMGWSWIACWSSCVRWPTGAFIGRACLPIDALSFET